MSEVQRFWSHELSASNRCVFEADFDRVTAERDAALRQVETITADRDAEKQMKAKARIQRDVQTAKATDLQERLTAADERAHVLEDDKIRLDLWQNNPGYFGGLAPSGDWSFFNPMGKTCYGKTLRYALDQLAVMDADLKGKK